jgi:choline dehydrogenase-like flavoprotein
VFALSDTTAERLRVPGATAVLQPVELADGSSVMAILLRGEQAPNPRSCVTLTSEVDRFGVPRPRVHWELGPSDKRAVSSLMEFLTRAFTRQGIGEVRSNLPYGDHAWPTDTVGGCHHLGTTPMGANVESGVVDRNCRVFGSDNLYVTGSSVFTTGGVANPTLTIVALSLRLAAHLAATLGLATDASLQPNQAALLAEATLGDMIPDELDDTGQFIEGLSARITESARALAIDDGGRSGP